MKRLHVFFSGYVQGVGFRYTARSIAHSLGLVGWVKNCYDGRVELTAEGDEEALQQMLSQLNRAFQGYINSSEVSWSQATGELASFSIKF